jgi:hypothetical protein
MVGPGRRVRVLLRLDDYGDVELAVGADDVATLRRMLEKLELLFEREARPPRVRRYRL